MINWDLFMNTRVHSPKSEPPWLKLMSHWFVRITKHLMDNVSHNNSFHISFMSLQSVQCWQTSGKRSDNFVSSSTNIRYRHQSMCFKMAELQPRFHFVFDSVICVNDSKLDFDSFFSNKWVKMVLYQIYSLVTYWVIWNWTQYRIVWVNYDSLYSAITESICTWLT